MIAVNFYVKKKSYAYYDSERFRLKLVKGVNNMRNCNNGCRNNSGSNSCSCGCPNANRPSNSTGSCSGCSPLTLSDLLEIRGASDNSFQPGTNIWKCSCASACEWIGCRLYCPRINTPGSCGCQNL